MKELVTPFIRAFPLAALALVALPVQAADYPAPKEADWVARDFRFHSGEAMPEVRLHYTTVGAPSGEPVLLLHGTAGAGATLLGKDFAGEFFGPGRPLDASRYFIILPDALGTDGEAVNFRCANISIHRTGNWNCPVPYDEEGCP